MNNSIDKIPAESRLQFWVRWSMTIGWAALIYHLSTITFTGSFTAMLLARILRLVHLAVSQSTFDTLHFLFRKLAHLTEYAIFGLFLYHGFLNSNRTEWRIRTAAISVLVAGIYSLTDEFHQIFVPGRTPSIIDCGIDTTGAALGMLLIYLYTRFFQSDLPPDRPLAALMDGHSAVSKQIPA
ncbi:MAG: VanZ family protein [Terriglobia bacterium]